MNAAKKSFRDIPFSSRAPISIRSAVVHLYFTRIFSGDTGLDLYTRAVSDVYQDLFGEGSYVGKGAYEVDSFERSLEGCIPENSLLSHDLLEGIHGRTALVTSTVLIEDMPPNYLVHARRHAPLDAWRLAAPAVAVLARLSSISRWKILDNLRRSLVARFSSVMVPGRLAGPARQSRGLDSCWSTCPGCSGIHRVLRSITPAFERPAGTPDRGVFKE